MVTMPEQGAHDPALVDRLTAAGYHRVDLVEEAGDFAVRGWVVDIHPGDEHAIRIVLDDDRVDRADEEPVQRAV